MAQTETSKQPPHVLGEASLEGLAAYIRDKDVRNILVLIGAGVSVAAGIPDFRSPVTGLYANLGKYNLDTPTDAFSLPLLRERPEVFYAIAGEMNLWPGVYKPTSVHHFVKLLADEGRLLRCCTQNVDGLERAAGVPDELVVEAHGSFRSASCVDCHAPYDVERNHREARDGVVSRCPLCGGVVKPDVVFFGEQLPERFFHVMLADTAAAELVFVIGTSLQVHPFAVLPLRVAQTVPRVVINNERVGGFMFRFPDDPPLLTSLSRSRGEGTDGDEEKEAEGTAATAATSREHDGASTAMTPYTNNDDDDDNNNVAAHDASDSQSTSSSDGYAQYGSYDVHPAIFRDLFIRGDCQASIERLAALLGLGERLAEAKRQSAAS